MSVKRRSRRSLLRTHPVAEVLEDKRLLSGTNDNAVMEVPSPVNAELSQWRQNVEGQIIERANDLYGDQFGQRTDAPIYYLRGVPIVGDAQFAAATERSETNVQVNGVDEGDIVETDGEYIYTISGNEIVIVKAASAEFPATVQSRIKFAETPAAMLLHDDRLTVISQESGYHRNVSIARFAPPAQLSTVVTVLDVANKQAPMLTQETIVDGQYLASRAIGDQVFVVVSNNDGIPYVPELQTVYEDPVGKPAVEHTGSIPRPDDGTANRYRFETRDEYLQRVIAFVHGDGTPYNRGLTPPSVYRRGDAASGEPVLERLGWLDAAGDATPDSGQLTSVLQIDTSSPEETPVSNVGLNTRRHSATQVYASASALYLVTEEYTHADQTKDGAFFDFAPPPATVNSRIHKIGLNTGRLVLEGEGVVPGSVESQFSIDEHNGYLRIVTTTGNNWWWNQETASQNHLFVLQDTGSALVEVGSIRDLATGERIYSARFEGNRAWMVTFRQVDPVFSFDLSDPTNPHVTGELKIPGYSDYLQLIDDDYLLAIGRNASVDGRVQEVQVSLFDVSDLTQPKLRHRYSMDSERWGASEALQNHLAFNYLSEAQLLAVPFGVWGQQGMVLLHVDVEDGIQQVGSIDQISGEHIIPWNRDNSYRRSVQIDDLLYAVSGVSIGVVALSDPNTVIQTLRLQDERIPPLPLPELPEKPRPLDGTVRLAEVFQDDGTVRELRIKLKEFVDQNLPSSNDIAEYEFRILDRNDGTARIRQTTTDPELELRSSDGELLEPGIYNVQVRTKVNRLRNPAFGAWSAAETLSVLSEQATMISEIQLQAGQRLLRWSRMADQVTMAADDQTALTNTVDHYEVWINNAANQRVLLNRDVNRPQLVLDLQPGDYFAWFRAVYEDGTTSDWSVRERFSLLADRLGGLIGPEATANASPEFAWTNITGVSSFEVEVTSANGTEIVYSADDIVEARHVITDTLKPGTYSFRVRATLATGGRTEWSEPFTFSIVGRPNLRRAGTGLELLAEHAKQIEVWVNRAATNERVFHDVDWQTTTVADAIAEFHLNDANPGQYSVWIRSLLPDGTRTGWSSKVSLNVGVADVVEVLPVAEFDVAADQTLAWITATGVESYEVFVRKPGTSGVLHHQTGIPDLSYTLPDRLGTGDYVYWVRGTLATGGQTTWGPAHHFSVTDRPQVSIIDGIVSWPAAAAGVRNEVWVNRVDKNLNLLETRVVHLRDFADNRFDLNTLPEGNYSIWVRTVRNDASHVVKSAWSERKNVSVSRLTDTVNQINRSVDDILDDVLETLNLF